MIAITIKYFGMLRDCVPQKEEALELSEMVTVARLKDMLTKKAPALKEKNFQVACERKLVDDNFIISTNAEVALLPPYSGG